MFFRKLLICCFLTVGAHAFLFGDGIERAGDYSKNSSLQWSWAMDALEVYPFRGDERILDIGSGDGKITATLAGRAPRGLVVGVDISDQMTQFASDTFPPAENKNLLFVRGDAAALPFHRQFDLVFSCCCLHWVMDQEKALASIRDSLASDGRVLLVLACAAPSNLGVRCEELASTEKWAPLLMPFKRERVYYTVDEYRSLVLDAGFEIVTEQAGNTIRNYPSRQALTDWLRPLLTFTAHLSAELQEEFCQDLTDRMVQLMPLKEDGTIDMPFAKMELLLKQS